MRRRRLIALAAAIGLFSLAFVVVSTIGVVTRTDMGQRWLAGQIQRRFLAPACHCTWVVGKIGFGGLLTGVIIDGVWIFDEHKELVLSARRVSASYDPRDLIDRRIYLHHVTLEQPYGHVRQFPDGTWNIRRVFKLDEKKPLSAVEKRLTPDLFLVLDSVRVVDGTFELSLPWSPDDSLRGAARDSAIGAHLYRTDQQYDSTAQGYSHRYQWRNLFAFLPHLRLSHPDSNKFGQEFDVGSMRVDERDPPFQFSDLRGAVRNLHDTLWVNFSHFDLPGSTGSATGTVTWGEDLPMRYDLAVKGDSMSMNDVAWIYPTLPRLGGGQLMLYIKNDPKNLHLIDYRLAKMDVRTTKSRLTGGMTFSVGGPVLIIKNVDLAANPVDFDLVRTLSGGPMAIDWQGQLVGTIKGNGGPLNDFSLQALNAEWRDTHVPGAVSRFSGRGGLDIMSPAFTVFHDFSLDLASLDLRSIEYLFPSFPRLNGTIAGTAVLDSVWSDVRFHDADLSHRDGAGEPSRITGAGRVTNGATMFYDVALDANVLDFDMLRGSYPTMLFKGIMGGPVRARGAMSDLELTANLQGSAGSMSFDGRVDLDSASGYGVHGKGDVAQLDLHTLLADSTKPTTVLNAHYDADLIFRSAADLAGTAMVSLEGSRVERQGIDSGRAALRFADGRATLDQDLIVAAKAATLRAAKGGGLGLPGGLADSLHVSVSNIQLDSLRRYVSSFPEDDSLAAVSLWIDSTATISGRVDSLHARGTLMGSRVVAASLHAKSLATFFDFDQPLTKPSGILAVHGDSATVGGLAFETTDDTLRLADSTQGVFAVWASANRHPDLDVHGSWTRLEGATSVLVQSANLVLPTTTATTTWTLTAPATVAIESTGTRRVNAFEFSNGTGGGSLGFGGVVPATGRASFSAHGQGIPVMDIANAAQLQGTYLGKAAFSAEATGTRLNPVMTLDSLTFDSLAMAFDNSTPAKVGRVVVTGGYQANTVVGDLKLFPHEAVGMVLGNTRVFGGPNVTAHVTLPMALTLFSGKRLKDSLSGTIDATDLQLNLLQPFVSGMTLDTVGKVTAHVSFSEDSLGLRRFGTAAVRDGALSVDSMYTKYRDVNGTFRLSGDTVFVDSLHAASRYEKVTGTADLKGLVYGARRSPPPECPSDTTFNPRLSLSLLANNFRVMNDSGLAVVDVTARPADAASLSGPLCRADLNGSVTLPHATIFIADPTEPTKQVSQLEAILSRSQRGSGDSTRGPGVVDKLLSNLQFVRSTRGGGTGEAFTINLGDDVRLQTTGSDVIDVKLASTGGLAVTRSTFDPGSALTLSKTFKGIGLTGDVTAVSGIYTFHLGIAQRQFTVQRGGAIQFRGDLNPNMTIGALTSVQVVGQAQRLGIIATLTGTLERANIDFSSDQQYPISPSDLVSYLTFGQPAFAVGSSALASIFSSTGSAALSGAIRSKVHLDALQFQLGTSNTSTTGSDPLSSGFGYVRSATVSGEKQLSGGFFYSFTTPLCAFKSVYQVDPNVLVQGVGLSLTYHLPDKTDSTGKSVARRGAPSLRAFADPPSASQFCSPGTLGLNGLAPTPRQYGLSILNSWTWR